ncbi:MAG: heme ABC transporter ATP-binding protein [Rhodobiaceae bacterium]|nr:heme ABC transporter ATP-binding protein [Rhodobiaceae bacterium]
MSIKSDEIFLYYNKKEILNNISLEIKEGEIITLLGPNGAGKSSLLNIISGDLNPDEGSVYYDNKEINRISIQERAFIRSVMAQSQPIVFDFNVKEIVEMGWLNRGDIKHANQLNNSLKKILIDCEIEDLELRKFNTLSGGEQKRVHFARTLLQLWRESKSFDSRYLMLDEPTSSLDLSHQVKMMNQIKKLANNGVGVLLILHDLNLAFKYSDKIAIIKSGKMVSYGDPKKIIEDDLLSEVYEIPLTIEEKENKITINYV